jgi:hypothetical protein
MKKLLFVACVITLILTGSVGCSKKPNGWYPIDGGYINLKNVKTITTHAELMIVGEKHRYDPINGSITRANIEKAKDEIREKYKMGIENIRALAYIEFDGFKVRLDSLPEFESYKDIIKLLDSWLDAVEELVLPAN